LCTAGLDDHYITRAAAHKIESLADFHIMGALESINAQISELIDPIECVLRLIPVSDHMTVSAVSCACHATVRLFAEWLRISGIIDVRAGLVAITRAGTADVNICDRLHGTITYTTTWRERFLLDSGVRAWVFEKQHMDELNDPKIGVYTFSFGQLIRWEYHTNHSEISEIIMVGDDLMIVAMTHVHIPRAEIRRLAKHPNYYPPRIAHIVEHGHGAHLICTGFSCETLGLNEGEIRDLLIPYYERAKQLPRTHPVTPLENTK
jgi:hypothetical protein